MATPLIPPKVVDHISAVSTAPLTSLFKTASLEYSHVCQNGIGSKKRGCVRWSNSRTGIRRVAVIIASEKPHFLMPFTPAIIGSRLFGFKRNVSLYSGVRACGQSYSMNLYVTPRFLSLIVAGVLSGYLFTQVSISNVTDGNTPLFPFKFMTYC